MTVAVSTDDGQTYGEDIEIPLTGEWNFDNMTYYFEVPSAETENGSVTYGTFAEGDTYRCVYWNPAEDFEYTNKANNAIISLHDDDPEKNPYLTAQEIGLTEIHIKIEKDGGLGTAIFTYRTNGTSWSEQMYVPEDGVFRLPETSLYVRFEISGSSVLRFTAGDTFSAAIPKKSIDPLYILIGFLAVAFGGGYFAINTFFKSKIVPQSVYTIHEYEPVRRNSPKRDDKEKAGRSGKEKRKRG